VVSIPSFQCRLNDVLSAKEKKTSKYLIKNNLKSNQIMNLPGHLKFEASKLQATGLNYCDRANIQLQLVKWVTLLVLEK
jgi:ribosomal protein S4